MSASFFGVLKSHNHTANVGDGGQLSNLSVTGTIASTGNVSVGGVASEAGSPSAPTDLPTIQFQLALEMVRL